VPDPAEGVLEPTVVLAALDALDELALLPKPSAFSAVNSDCKKLCTACCGLLVAVVAGVVVAAVLAAVTLDPVVALVAAAEVVGELVGEVSAEAATEAIGLLPTTTCSSVDSRLLNNPCVDDEVELDVPDVDSVLDSVLESFCTLLRWPCL